MNLIYYSHTKIYMFLYTITFQKLLHTNNFNKQWSPATRGYVGTAWTHNRLSSLHKQYFYYWRGTNLYSDNSCLYFTLGLNDDDIIKWVSIGTMFHLYLASFVFM